MNRLVRASLAVALGLPALTASAQCTGTPLNAGQLTTLLSGNTVCGRPAAGYPGAASDRWQEQHRGGAQLWDYKRGPSDAVDPTERVGSWSIQPGVQGFPATVTHSYLGGTSFNWSVYATGTGPAATYSFCNAARVEFVRAFVVPGVSGGCSGSFPP